MLSLREAQLRYATYFASLLKAADNLYERGGEYFIQALAIFDAEWGNIQVGQTWPAENAERDELTAMLCKSYPSAGAFLLCLRQSPKERIHWLQSALASARRLQS